MLNDSTIIEDLMHDDMVGPDESEDNSLRRYRVGEHPLPLPRDEEGLERRAKIEEKIARMTTFEIWRKRKGLSEAYADVFDWEPERVHSEYLKLSERAGSEAGIAARDLLKGIIDGSYTDFNSMLDYEVSREKKAMKEFNDILERNLKNNDASNL